MISTPHYGAFNARWLSFEEVAETFVPVPQFLQLGHESHSVLLGPRGCGKTTLLKMLTRQALDSWDTTGRAARFQISFPRPRYEAIYISSDVRWSYKLARLPETANLSPLLSLQAQRTMVSANALFNILETIEAILTTKKEIEVAIAEGLIRQWRLTNTLKSIADIKSTLRGLVAEIRGHLNVGDISQLQRSFNSVPATFYGHTLDAPIDAIALISERLPDSLRPPSWALCYDELEIAPEWLRTELLESLRSARQGVLLKLTWSPLLPSGLRTSPESAADFKAIRLWHSHVADPRAFCEELTQDFLRERFPSLDLTPGQFFSRSILAAEKSEEPVESYERGSTEYEAFKALASWDQSFRACMEDKQIDPDDPVPKSAAERDQFFRKVKPVTLLRLEFTTEEGERTRKRLTIYAGKEAVYTMSEGNPRWLRGLLNDFADLGGLDSRHVTGTLRIPYKVQAKLLNTAGQRFLALIKASPFKPPNTLPAMSDTRDVTLIGFINAVGSFFHTEIYGREFPLDPIGSFTVPEGADQVTLAIIEQLLELGGLVYIGTSPQDVPGAIVGSRFRLSFLLAPIHKLALRIYRETSLEEIQRVYHDDRQMDLKL